MLRRVYLFHALIRETVLNFSAAPGTDSSTWNWFRDTPFLGGEGFKLIKKSAHNTTLNLLHPNVSTLISLPSLTGRTCLVHCSRSFIITTKILKNYFSCMSRLILKAVDSIYIPRRWKESDLIRLGDTLLKHSSFRRCLLIIKISVS